MANQSGKTGNPLKEHLVNNSKKYDFFQAVGILEQLNPDRVPVGHDGPPTNECVHFSPTASFNFATSEISAIKFDKKSDDKAVEMETAFLSLYGRDGALPWHYTTQLRDEFKDYRKSAMKEFLDIFNHRMISYFYRAGIKYRLPTEFTADVSNPLFRNLAAFVGLATRGLSDCIPKVSHSLYKYSSVFQQPRSAESLQMMLKDMFGTSILIEEFKGEWVKISKDARSSIGRRGINNILGRNICVGKKTWSTQHKFRIAIGPLKFDDYVKFKPGTEEFEKMIEVTRLFCGHALIFDVQFKILKWSIQRFQLNNRSLQLGSDLWLTDSNIGNSEDVVTRIHSVE